MGYGIRYLELSQFISHCEKLNVKVDKDELEYYEEKGIMFPVARVLMPQEYVKWSYKDRCSPGTPRPRDWAELDRLCDRPLALLENYVGLSDDEMVDAFDREFERNPYLIRPDSSNYHPWDSYRVIVDDPNYPDMTESTATHYYSYWQVYQLHEIKRFPDLYENLYLLDQLSEEFKKQRRLPRSYNVEVYRSFDGRTRYFDALSFYITMYAREEKRTFAQIPEHDRVRTLNDQQHRDYVDRLSSHAKFVANKYGLEKQNHYEFLVNLLDLRRDYQRAECLKLAKQLENDIVYQARLINGATGQEWEAISDELGKTSFWHKRDFRRINPTLKELDGARELLSHYLKVYVDELARLNIQAPVHSFSESDVDEILVFCREYGLNILTHTLDDMIATEDEGIKFRRVNLYASLKNLTTSFEYLLKAIAGDNITFKRKENTLTPIVKKMMEKETGWIGVFKQRVKDASAQDSAAFFSHLTSIMNDPQFFQSEDGFWARSFLVACLARNLTVHSYPTDNWFYGDLFGEMIRSVVYCILYSWHVAKREHWV